MEQKSQYFLKKCWLKVKEPWTSSTPTEEAAHSSEIN